MWTRIKDKLPEHKEVVLVRNSTGGHSVCVFIDSIEMNETLKRNGLNNFEDVQKNPYHFCSQEVQGATLNDVQHWMPLPDPPK